MAQYQVEKFAYTSTGGYVCYPKVSSNDNTWDGRTESNGWAITFDDPQTVNLLTDCGGKFQAGDIVFAAIDVVAGNDAAAYNMFVVTENGSTANFNASGTALNTSLTYSNTQ